MRKKDKTKRKTLTLAAVVTHRMEFKRQLKLSDSGEITREEWNAMWRQTVTRMMERYGLTRREAGFLSLWEWDHRVWKEIYKMF